MNRIILGADDIYSHIISIWGKDNMYYYYTTPWTTRIVFSTNAGFTKAFMAGNLKEVTLIHVVDDLYMVGQIVLYRYFYNRNKNHHDY